MFPVYQPDPALLRLTYVMYALHLFSAFVGALTSVAIVTAFLTGWPSLLALIINYVKRSESQGTILESHFIWQARTFWFAFGGMLVAGLLAITIIGIPIAWGVIFFIGLWVLYRMISGVIALQEGRPMPIP